MYKVHNHENYYSHDIDVVNLTNTGCPRKKCVLEPNLTGCSGNHFPEAAGQFHVFFSLDRLILTARNTHKISKTHLFL